MATAGGTLVLAVATFSAIRSANRAARTAERSLLAGLRPVLVPSKMQDPPEKLMWLEQRWTKVLGGSASVELLDDVVYLAMSLRNVGSGIAVIHGWHPMAGLSRAAEPHESPDVFRPQTRDLYIPPGDTGFWQGALRNPDEEEYGPIRKTVEARSAFTIDLLYGDHEGGQRAISRFTVVPREGSEETTAWLLSVSRHWNVDRSDPRRPR